MRKMPLKNILTDKYEVDSQAQNRGFLHFNRLFFYYKIYYTLIFLQLYDI